MGVAAKIAALCEALKGEDFSVMTPTERRHIRELCRFIAEKADPDKPDPAKIGLLVELRDGRGLE